jgi:hypothetical protein
VVSGEYRDSTNGLHALEDKRTTFQVRLSKAERDAIHQEARNRGITACELFRQYAQYLMEDDNG